MYGEGSLGVSEPHHLYRLTMPEMLTLPGFKEKRAERLLSGIEASSNPSWTPFYQAAIIPGVGRVTAQDLAKAFKP